MAAMESLHIGMRFSNGESSGGKARASSHVEAEAELGALISSPQKRDAIETAVAAAEEPPQGQKEEEEQDEDEEEEEAKESLGGGIRKSERIKSQGIVRRYYIQNIDGVFVESSFVQRVKGNSSPLTHIGALESEGLQDGGSNRDVLVDEPSGHMQGKALPCWSVKGHRAKCNSASRKANGRYNVPDLDLNKRFCGPSSAFSSSNRAQHGPSLLKACRGLEAMTMDLLQTKSYTLQGSNLLASQAKQPQKIFLGWNSAVENADEPTEDPAQGMQHHDAQQIVYCLPNWDGGSSDQFKQLDSRQNFCPECEDQAPTYVEDTTIGGCFARSFGKSGDEVQLQYSVHYASCEELLQGAHRWSTPSTHIEQNTGVFQGISINKGAQFEQNTGMFQGISINNGATHRSGGDMVTGGLREPTTFPQTQFPFNTSLQAQNWLDHNASATGPSMSVNSDHNLCQGGDVPWTGNGHDRLPSHAERCVQGQPVLNLQREECFRPSGYNDLNYGRSRFPLQTDNKGPQLRPSAAPSVNLSPPNSQGIHMDLLRQVGAFAPNSGGHAVGGRPCNTSSLQPNAPVIEIASVNSSSQARLTCDTDLILPSSLQNLEGLDAHSVTGAGDHLNESPSACSNDASKKERLSCLRGRMRDGSEGSGTVKEKVLVFETTEGQADGTSSGKGRLTAVRSEIRKGIDSNGREEDLLDGEPQQKTKRKKIRCKVQRDEKKQRGRRGSQKDKAKKVPQGANLQQKVGSSAQEVEFAEIGLSSDREMTNFAGILPSEKAATKLCQDAGAAFNVICNTLFEESGTAGSGIYNSRLDTGRSFQSWNMVAHSGTGLDSGKPPFIDYLALSDQQHRAETKSFSSRLDPNDHILLGCQDIVLYEPMHHLSQSNNLPLCLFSKETSSTGSSGTTDIIPVPGSSNNLPLAKVKSDENLQLVLYNQKRDIVVSKFRSHKKIRAKVLLDPESQRVWLQLENGAGPKANDDPDKAWHWEKQRRDMKEKVESFIKKMHDVQGDRKFSPWKGSIVDSVVGAFLTQNVSDHLSSSAFMSVASRFPPVSKNSRLVSSPGLRETFPFDRESAMDLIPPSLESFPFSNAEELASSRQVDSEGTDSICIHESSYVEGGFGKRPTQLSDNSLYTFPCISNVEGASQHHHKMLINSHPLERNKQDLILASDNEHTLMDTILEDPNSCGALEDISGAFRQQCAVHKSKARRLLNFGIDSNKYQTQLCSTLEPDKEVRLAIILDGETASDNISDQHSESESAAGSSSSVHSVQDSNLHLSIVQENKLELDITANTVQTSSRELAAAAETQSALKISKKRPMPLSSISGMERAQLEANQKGRKRNHHGDWESVRKQALGLPSGAKESLDSLEPRSSLHEDSVNWDAVRFADLAELADTIKERGMHHVLSGRIKAFLTSVHEDHGSIDLEWLRNLSSEKAREYLMSIHGLGVKSVECIRLLTLHHLAFPVDTNVGRICVRLGWVPIEPLPEEVQLHLVELYPIQETIQKYLWPRLCTLDQRTLYELHYQLITFGKVFCTKSKPNCNACPLRTECRHFASAYASSKPLLTGPETDQRNRICSGVASKGPPILGMDLMKPSLLEYPQDEALKLFLSMEGPIVSEIDSNTALLYSYQPPPFGSSYKEFFVEEPNSPEQNFDGDVMDIEDIGKPMYYYDTYNDYCPELLHDDLSADHANRLQVSNSFTEGTKSVNLNTPCAQLPSLLSKDLYRSPHQSSDTDFGTKMPCCNSQFTVSCNSTSERRDYSTDLVVEVAQNAIVPVPEAAQIPAPKLKSVGRLRTVHYVYELPDDHSLLKMVEVDAREKDDPCSYLLAIWSPGETPESQQEINELCRDDSSMHSIGRADENVAGTLLIPCRTAMHGSFPLNGTYFQVNEVFADHASSLHPLHVPRSLIWSLRRRFVYFGTSVPNIFKGLSTEEIKDCFWRGHVCVRGFDRKTRAPKPLVCRLHFPISKQPQKPGRSQGRKKEEKAGFSSTSHT
ncbi:hypothetical protein L7F22_046510 [Adiantum nelumboides]|nr:hypothetical protein [Adiantum nelumboides]